MNRTFDMTLEECRLVFDTFDNLVIIDDKGLIKYLSPDMYFTIEAYNKKPVPQNVVGRHILDVHFVSKITNALETSKPRNTVFYFSSNVTNVARIEPIFKDGKLCGAIDYDLFTDGNELKKFVDAVIAYNEGGFAGPVYDDVDVKHMLPNGCNNFDMTLEECEMVFDTFKNLIITDKDCRIKYMSPDLHRLFNSFESVIGRHVNEVHKTCRIPDVISNGKAMKAVFYKHGGNTSVARIEPVYKDDRIIGAIDYDLFTNEKDIKNFIEEVNDYKDVGILNFENTFESMYDSSKKIGSIKYTINNILGNGRLAKKLRTEISNISENNATVLITGKTGTGKELVAHSIHNLSLRADKPIVAVNCAAIPDNLFESELFGYEEGSFTGAQKGGKKGFFEQADGGTLFLDEIDQLPYHVQPKLLRVLQEREITPIGGSRKDVDIRVIAATNKDLPELVGENKFREDLYYRLNVVEIHIPSLAERREDIPLLAEEQMKRLNRQLMKNIKGISDDVMKVLLSYDWPGNVRELFNVMERSMVNCRGDILTVEDLGDFGARLGASELHLFLDADSPLEEVRNRAEKAAIAEVLEITGGNKSMAAKMLKISRPSFYEKLKKYNF